MHQCQPTGFDLLHSFWNLFATSSFQSHRAVFGPPPGGLPTTAAMQPSRVDAVRRGRLGLGGLLGGLALGALRFATSRDPRSSITVGWTVCGLLYGTNWFVCRRAMYAGIKEEADVLNGVSLNDPEAIKRYLAHVEARDGKLPGSSRD